MTDGKWVSVMMDADKARELDLQKLESTGSEELYEILEGMRAREILRFTKMLISECGTERTKQLIEENIYSIYHDAGREAAEKLGNPQGLDAYLQVYPVEAVGMMAFAPHCLLFERTKNRAVWGVTRCVFAEQLEKFGKSDPETLDVAKSRCVHDAAWAKGFNPRMRCERTQFLLNGDGSCEWTCELSE